MSAQDRVRGLLLGWGLASWQCDQVLALWPAREGPPEGDTYTTGGAARLTRLSQQTIIRDFDAGELGGWRHPGRGRFRRIPRAALVRYAVRKGLALDRLAPTAEELAAAAGEVG